MIDVVASEWLKVRTVRSTWYLLLSVVGVLALGSMISYLMTKEWDRSAPEIQAAFASADPSVVVMPFAQFAFGVLGALVATSEYGNGMIRTVLVAAPRRLVVLAAKVVVVGLGGLVLGTVVSFAAFGIGEVIVGDRPAPLSGGPFSEALPALLANGLAALVIALVGLGFGVLMRATAGALVTLCVLMFVLPVVAVLLPAPWNNRVVSVTPLYLGPQFSGQLTGQLTPAQALVVMIVYVVVALGAGALVLARRDA
ncbi:ABC transporter permease [Umezawaea sp. Da 62-37]|uniref:ABC transporter permease n=1 Tax=Umezawaea sp. Da 62-37 TaxID=3075927 RepID=UPI0028F6FFAB|nr:ABC transporter permease [Umezawaea sp. Da 62-37]WNV88663.1 ABC transporter permease [Umezawaea sp. Da 62-37]